MIVEEFANQEKDAVENNEKNCSNSSPIGYYMGKNEDNIPFKYYHLTGTLSTVDTTSKIFNAASAKKFAIKYITSDKYPIYEPVEDADGYSSLTCTKGNDTYEYKFLKSQLVSVRYNSFVSKSSENFSNISISFKDLLNNYSKETGYTVVYDETSDPNNLKFSMNIDYMNAIREVETGLFYSKDESFSTIEFEMESELYSCK